MSYFTHKNRGWLCTPSLVFLITKIVWGWLCIPNLFFFFCFVTKYPIISWITSCIIFNVIWVTKQNVKGCTTSFRINSTCASLFHTLLWLNCLGKRQNQNHSFCCIGGSVEWQQTTWLHFVLVASPPHGGDVMVYVWHKPTELAHSFLFCSHVSVSVCVALQLYFMLYIPPTTLPFLTVPMVLSLPYSVIGPFNYIFL